MGSCGKFALIALVTLSACAGPIETRVVSTGQGASANTILVETTPAGAIQALAYQQTLEQLQSRGFEMSDKGALQLHVAFSERDASISIKAGDGKAMTDLSLAKKRKPLQSCDDRDLKLTISLTRITDGVELYRSEAAEHHCKASVVEVLPSLISAALRDIGRPKGGYVVNRAGRD